jgi:predicted MFS family arabinose efflux permease
MSGPDDVASPGTVAVASTGVGRFRAVFAPRSVRWAASGAIAGRLAQTTMPLTLLLVGEQRLGDFTTAGALVGAYALAGAAAAPVIGRLIDRWGNKALVVLASVSSAAIVGLALMSSAAWMFTAVLLAGFTTAPLGAFLRAVVVRALPPGGQAAALSLDAVTTEVLFVVGPMLAGVTAAAGRPHLALFICAALMLIGAVLFVPAGSGGTHRGVESARARVPSLTVARKLSPILVMAMALATTIGIVEVSVTARAAQWQVVGSAGVFLGLWAFGSIIGGLAYGSRDWPGTPRAHTLLLLPLVGIGFAVLTPVGSVTVMYPVVVIAGVGIAPALTALARLVGLHAPPGSTTEAFAWLGAATALGGATGVAVAGVIADHYSASTGFCIAAVTALLTTVLVARRGR